MITAESIPSLREGQRLEFKTSKNALPKAVWESYSAFANTEGGTILLGVNEDEEGRPIIEGVTNPQKVIDEFWTTVSNSKKVSKNVLVPSSIKEMTIEDKRIIVVNVPRAERSDRPVTVKEKRDFVARLRKGSCDIKASDAELLQMKNDGDGRADRRLMMKWSPEVINPDTLSRYRNLFASVKRTSPWVNEPDDQFLYHIGAVNRGEDGSLHLTKAGLLAFGNEPDITASLPHFLLDYRQQTSGATRWDDRVVSQSGDWSGNLIDFFFMVSERLHRHLAQPFSADMLGQKHGTNNPFMEAINEALANTLVHAYYDATSSLSVILDEANLTFSNPGTFLIDKDVAILGGLSESRNPTIMRIFSFIGVSDRAGSGLQNIFQTWNRISNKEPRITLDYCPASVSLCLPIDSIVMSSTKRRSGERQNPRLDDEKLIEYIISCSEPISTLDVVNQFGVSPRVAQIHLAKIASEPTSPIKRNKVGTSYLYSK